MGNRGPAQHEVGYAHSEACRLTGESVYFVQKEMAFLLTRTAGNRLMMPT